MKKLFRASALEFLKKIAPDSRSFFLVTFIDRAASLAFYFLLAKIFIPEQYGQVIAIFSVAFIAGQITDFGLPIYLQKETANGENRALLLSSVLTVRIFSIIPYLSIIAVFFYVFNQDFNFLNIVLISISVFFANLVSLINYFYYGIKRIDITLSSIIKSKIIFLVLLLFIWLYNSTIQLFIAALLLSSTLQFIFLLSKLSKVGMNLRIDQISFQFIKKILFVSSPLAFAVLFNLLYDKIDILLISGYLDNYFVAQYSVAYNFYKLAGVAFSVILIPSFTFFSSLHKVGKYETNAKGY